MKHPQNQSWERWMRWEQLGAQSLRWTTGRKTNLLVFLLLSSLFHLLLATFLPPAEDELYYWTWSQNWSLSYFDHPPMVAWLIRLSTSLVGNSLFGIRLPAVLGTTFILWVVGTVTGSLLPVIVISLTPICAFLSIVMTPDIPLMVFWVLYLFWVMRLNELCCEWSGDPVQRVYQRRPLSLGIWITGGVLLGLGCLGKYTMALAPFCLLALLVFNYRMRAWGMGFLLHGLVAFLVSSPILIHNIRTDFAPLLFQWNHIRAGGGSPLAFLASQAVLVGVLPLLALPWVLLAWSRLTRSPRDQAALYFYAIPLLFFIFRSFRGFVDGNWGLVAYPGLWFLIPSLVNQSSFKRVASLFVTVTSIPCAVASLLLIIHSFSPLGFVPAEKDRVTQLAGKYTAAKLLAPQVRKYPDVKLYVGSYQWASYFRFQNIPAEVYLNSRPSQFPQVNPCHETRALGLEVNGSRNEAFNCFPQRLPIANFDITVRKTKLWDIGLVLYSTALAHPLSR